MKYICDINLHKKDVSVDALKDYISDQEPPYKNQILRYMKLNRFISACTTAKVHDLILDKDVNISMVAYRDDEFYWDDRDIYHFDKYNIRFNDDFINHVLNAVKG